MADFKLVNTKKPFIIRGEDDEIIFSKSIDIGNKELISNFEKMAKAVEKLQNDTTNESMTNELLKLEKEAVKIAFPTGYEKLYEIADDNILIYNQIITELTGMIK